MSKRKFEIIFNGTANIELDNAVINAVDEDFKNYIYNLTTIEQIVKHLAYNLIINDEKLSQLDGWADQLDENAKILSEPDWEIEVTEITKK